MLQKLIQRRQKGSEEGFTLIELMVVVLIIAILIAIAIPTFLGARQRAQNRSAQANIRNALTAEKTSYTDNQAYTSSSGALQAIEPRLTFVATTPASTGNQVFVAVGTNNVANDTVELGAQSASGNCYWVQDVATGVSPDAAGTLWNTSKSCSSIPAIAAPQTGGWTLQTPPS
ncbi:MAG: prepilin-type N-terminal cleavage/methylation domain-containing protein [Acidimicrobiia bacterium]|nr:prepilin-type N-terminal cleavage/methylation domain-containing protein [Acidimicrobiia bacterium]